MMRAKNQEKLSYRKPTFRMGRELCDGKNHYVIWMGPIFSLPNEKELIGKCTCKDKKEANK